MGAILLLLALLTSYSGSFVRIDNVIYDLGWRLTPHPAANNVIIVAIDETSLADYGRWPWSRGLNARLINAVCRAQPSAIGVDIAFVEQGHDPLGNQQLQQAITQCGKVSLPVIIEASRAGGQILELPPVPELTHAAAGLGRVGVVMDADGVTRSVNLWEGTGTPAWPLLAQVLLQQSRQLPPEFATLPPVQRVSHPYTLVSADNRLLDFVGETGTIPRISANVVLSSKKPIPALHDKIVLIGATAAGMGDFIATPATTLGAPMPGVEVLANTLVSMRDGHLKTSMPTLLAMLITTGLALLPLLWLPRLMPLSGLMASVAWVIILVILSALLPYMTGYRFAPAGALFAALLAYPLSSWRRLEAARRHLDSELLQLGAANTQASTATAQRMNFEQRILAVQAAQQQLRQLQTEREDMLAFISHDIRVPLASAEQQLAVGELDMAGRERLSYQIQRAHRMAQDYLSIARAVDMKVQEFTEIDIIAVADQAMDSLYELSRQRGVKLVRALPDNVVWVYGDFALLERAIINLISNAISFTPADKEVTIGAHIGAHTIQLWVQDSGAGIAANMLPRLFQRYQRGSETRANSTGMGLYFVGIVAEKHGATVSAANHPPLGARFTITFKRLDENHADD
ncbi:MAG: CHASE2 domain-containing protein [Sulfuriferula sp.]